MRALKLAWRYVVRHRFKSLLMVLCIVLTTLMPIALSILLASFNHQIVARARDTPLVVGAPGSRVDLAMHALYFKSKPAGTITLGDQKDVRDDGTVIPVYSMFTARSVPVVGTTLEYFEFRNIGLESGQGLVRLGDCVLGYQVARQLDLGPGDTLMTDRNNILEFAGRYPLKMRVAGVLEETRSPDDDAVFVDLKTAWVVEGFGHGHQEVGQQAEEGAELAREGDSVTLNASVSGFMEITEDNLASFHFHGDFQDFPVTALIVIPNNNKSETLMLGRFQSDDATAQMSEPLFVVEELMGLVFRVQSFFNANAILIAVSTALLLTMVVLLSIRLRDGEMRTMFKIGCSRGTMASLVAAELLIVFAMATVCICVAVLFIQWNADDLVRSLLSRAQG